MCQRPTRSWPRLVSAAAVALFAAMMIVAAVPEVRAAAAPTRRTTTTRARTTHAPATHARATHSTRRRTRCHRTRVAGTKRTRTVCTRPAPATKRRAKTTPKKKPKSSPRQQQSQPKPTASPRPTTRTAQPATTTTTTTSTTAGAPQGSLPFLHTSGTQIVDSAGHAIQLRGVDLGGWLVWEGWIFGGGFDSETTMMTRLASLVGQPAADRFHADVQDTFITEADVAAIASLGFNVIRVPFNYRILEDPANPFVWKESGWHYLDEVVSWAQKYGLYVVFEMQAAPGGQALGFVYDPSWPLLWDSTSDEQQTVAIWQAIAQRYAADGNVAGYDVLGEPWPTPNDGALVSLYGRIVAAIRQVDARHMLFIEGAQDSRDFSWATAPLDANMVYSPHMYLWSRGSLAQAQSDLNGYAQLAGAQHVPLWIGEFGEDYASRVQAEIQMFAGQPAVAGWAYWTWKKAPNWADSLEQIPVSPSWTALAGWLDNPSAPQPSVAAATQAMADFVSEIRFGSAPIGQSMVTSLTSR